MPIFKRFTLMLAALFGLQAFALPAPSHHRLFYTAIQRLICRSEKLGPEEIRQRGSSARSAVA